MPAPRHTLFMFTLLVLALPGCGVIPMFSNKPTSSTVAGGRSTPAQVQSVVMAFADSYIDRMTQLSSDIAATAPDVEARAVFSRDLAGTAGAMFGIATQPNPMLALTDTIVLVTLRRKTLERQWIQFVPEELRERTITAFRLAEAEAWAMGETFLTADQVTALREEIDAWARDNPDQNFVNRIRLSDLAARRYISPEASSSGPRSIFALLALDPLANMDPTRREIEQTRMTAERMFFFFQRTSQLLAWQSKQVVYEIAATPEIRRTLAAAEDFATAARSLQRFLDTLPEERRAAIEQASAEASRTIDLAVERLADAVSAERRAFVGEINSSLTAQREEILATLDSAAPKVHSLLAESRQTLDAVSSASASLQSATATLDTFIARWDGPSERDPNARRFDVTEYGEAAKNIGEASVRLTAAIAALDQLIAAPGSARADGQPAALPGAITQATAASEQLVNLIYRRAMTVVITAILGLLGAALCYRVVSARLARPA